MLHFCRIPVLDDDGRLIGSIPVWFIGVGIMSGFFLTVSTLFVAGSCFLGVMEVGWFQSLGIESRHLMPFGLLAVFSFFGQVWHQSVMESIEDYQQKAMKPAVKYWPR